MERRAANTLRLLCSIGFCVQVSCNPVDSRSTPEGIIFKDRKTHITSVYNLPGIISLGGNCDPPELPPLRISLVEEGLAPFRSIEQLTSEICTYKITEGEILP